MTLLTMVNNVQKRLGLEVITNPTANADPTSKKMVALANIEGKDLALRYSWSVLQKIETQAALAAEDQGTLASIVADMSIHHIRHLTMWNQTTDRAIEGPLSPREWSDLKGSGIAYAWDHWRIYGGKLYITPAPALNDSIAFEYISKNWCQSSGGTGQAAWAADTDTGILDEDMMELGLTWRFLQSEGMSYAQEFEDYERRVMQAMSMDGGKPTLTMAGGSPLRGVVVANSVTRSF